MSMAFLAGTMTIIIMIMLVWLVLQVIASWMIFTKAGEAGWKALIPIYSSYLVYKIAWNTAWFWLVLVSGIVSSFLRTQSDNGPLMILGQGLIIATTVIGCINYYKLSKSFGHGIGFTLGLIFLNPIFLLILGLDSSGYEGPQ